MCATKEVVSTKIDRLIEQLDRLSTNLERTKPQPRAVKQDYGEDYIAAWYAMNSGNAPPPR